MVVRRPQGRRRPRPARRRGRDRQRDRPERRREDDAVQPHHGRVSSRPAATSSSTGASITGLEPHQITRRGIARTFQTLRLFLNMSVRENVMAAAYGHTKAGVFRSMLRTPGHAPRGAGDPRARREAARVLRRSADGVSLGPARLQPLVRKPASTRDRPGDRDEPDGCSSSTSPLPG